jgi:hypothetical protein
MFLGKWNSEKSIPASYRKSITTFEHAFTQIEKLPSRDTKVVIAQQLFYLKFSLGLLQLRV